MAALSFLLLAAALAGRAGGDPVDRWSGEIAEASARFDVPEAWIRRVMRAESGGRARIGGRPTVSRAGAIGLMQLMPGTWGEIRLELGLGNDPNDPHDNILAGAFYLRSMYDRFGYPGLFAAYNSGPARYLDYLSGARPLPAETRLYAARVAGGEARTAPAPGLSPSGIFAVDSGARLEGQPSPTIASDPRSLFVELGGGSGR